MLWFAVMVLMVGIVAGAIAREVAAEPHVFGDLGPWSFGIAGSAIGAIVGFVAAGADSQGTSDQWAALLLAIAGAAIGAGAFVVISGKRQHDLLSGAAGHGDGQPTPVSGARDSDTGATRAS
jgi:uncharacterized membrane protein YeaQ/YmgE (transglycosylase-associated protein family)